MKLIFAFSICTFTVHSQQNCKGNDECIQEQGKGACCLFYQEKQQAGSWKCRPKAFVQYYTEGELYNKITKEWRSPDNKYLTANVYCKYEKVKDL